MLITILQANHQFLHVIKHLYLFHFYLSEQIPPEPKLTFMQTKCMIDFMIN